MNHPNPYPGLYQQFRWLVPTRFSISEVCCQRWANNPADARRIALFLDAEDAPREIWTFERIQESANRLAHAFHRMGVKPGDRVALILPPRGEFLVTLFATWMVGAVCVPLPPSFDDYALERSLRDSAARVVVVDASSHLKLLPGLHRCTALQQMIGIDTTDERVVPWRGLLARQSSEAPPVVPVNDVALLFYQTRAGQAPRGLAHGHAALVGVLPGFVASHDWFPRHSSSFWVGLDWATPAGLLGGVLPCLYFGRALVASRTASSTYGPELMRLHGVSHALVSPTILQQWRYHSATRDSAPPPSLRQITSTGQRLSAGLRQWLLEQWHLSVNDRYGTAEAPIIAGHSHTLWESPHDSLGAPYPGHRLAILDANGQELGSGQVGDIAIAHTDIHHEPDPALWLGPWPLVHEASDTDWFLTGDRGYFDEQGFLWLQGPAHQLLTLGGTQVDPEVLEAALLNHPDILDVGVVALGEDPDHIRLKAWIIAPGIESTAALQPTFEQLRQQLWPAAALAYPCVLELTHELPRQANGRLLRPVLRSRDRSRRRRNRKATA